MSHKRKEIRDALVKKIQNAPYFSQITLMNGIKTALDLSKLPAVVIYSLEETIVNISTSRELVSRTFLIGVEVVVSDESNIDDQLDSWTKKLESTLLDDPRLGGLIQSLAFIKTEMNWSFDGETVIGRAKLVFEAYYREAYYRDTLDDAADHEQCQKAVEDVPVDVQLHIETGERAS